MKCSYSDIALFIILGSSLLVVSFKSIINAYFWYFSTPLLPFAKSASTHYLVAISPDLKDLNFLIYGIVFILSKVYLFLISDLKYLKRRSIFSSKLPFISRYIPKKQGNSSKGENEIYFDRKINVGKGI